MGAPPVKTWPEGIPLEEAEVACKWRERGFTCGLWIDPPGQQWLDYVHATDELLAVKEGVIEVEIEGSLTLLHPGDEVFIPAGARHSVSNRGDSTARWFYGYRKAHR